MRRWKIGSQPTGALGTVASLALVLIGVALVTYTIVAMAKSEKVPEVWVVALGIGAVAIGGRLLDVTEISASGSGVQTKLTPPTPLTAALADEAQDVEPESVDEVAEQVAAARLLAAEHALFAILRSVSDPEDEYPGARLYILDSATRDLAVVAAVGVAVDAARATERWRVGQGATGAAYSRGVMVYADGDAVYDGTYGVTAEQAERFKEEGLTAVAAIPVVNAVGTAVAVITATSVKPGGGHLPNADAALELLTPAALAVGRVLVDLLQWFGDDYTEQ